MAETPSPGGEPPTQPGGEPPLPAEPSLPAEAAGEQLPDVDLLAAALRADHGDLDTYSRVLLGSLAEALPEGVIEVERERTLADRMGGRPGKVTAVRIRLGDLQLDLEAGRHGLRAVVARQVRGVAISRKEVPVAEWARQLAAELQRLAAESAAARAALGRLLGAE